jgi:RNA polymerase sigma-70 factor (ECF subfamily)
VQLDQLTAEMGWIRRLAMALVKDASTADDVAQEAYLAAAGHVPLDRPLRPWLSRVVLNVVRMRGRSAKRREFRELAAPSPDTVPTAAELIDRVELQRRVAGEVLSLAEPYRSTVLLHYFEDLSSAEIARRSGVPEGTVRRRLKVALDELSLQREGGRRDDDPLPVRERGHEIAERLSGTGAGLHQQVGAVVDRVRDGFGHGHLAGALRTADGSDGSMQEFGE